MAINRTTRNVQRSIHARNSIQSRSQAARGTALDPNELKSVVRDGLVSMTMAEREDFIQGLEAEMRRANLNMRAYLIPLGIPGRSPEDLTPTEVGHLIRFLKINVPQAMTAVERAMARFGIFAEKANQTGDRLAA
jgi:hypothetical protein